MFSDLSNISSLVYFPKIGLSDLFEIFILIFIIYKIIYNFKDTRAWIIFKGLFVLLVFYFLSFILSFHVITMILKGLIILTAFVILIALQQDIRKLIERIGNKNFKNYLLDTFKKSGGLKKRFSDQSLYAIVDAVFSMAEKKTGALIVLEKDIPMDDIRSTGVSLNSDISSQLLINIFEDKTPLHDGAVIIGDNKVLAAATYLPLSNNPSISQELGTRHRAGIGISESTDCFVIICSEETGKVSKVENGKIDRDLSKKDLYDKLKSFQLKKEEDIKGVSEGVFHKYTKLKILSILLGSLTWLIATVMIDPVVTRTFPSIEVQVKNENLIQGKTCDLGDNKFIDVTLEDRRSALEEIEASDIGASVDLKELSITNAVNVNASLKNPGTTRIKGISKEVINVEIDDISYLELPVEIVKTGTAPKGLSVKTIYTDPPTINVSGPKRVIKNIKRAVCLVDVSKAISEEKVEYNPVFYDNNEDIMDENIKIMETNLSYVVIFEKTKEIPLNIEVVDAENSAGKINSFDYKPKYITIAGDKEALDQSDEINIKLPIKIEVNDMENTKMTKIVDLRDYVGGALKVDGSQDNVSIEISYTPYPSKKFDFNKDDIEVINPPPGLTYEISENVKFVLEIASEEAMEKKDIRVKLDLKDIEGPGIKTVPLQVEFDKGFVVKQPKDIPVKIEMKDGE